jgi:hypothetical protein
VVRGAQLALPLLIDFQDVTMLPASSHASTLAAVVLAAALAQSQSQSQTQTPPRVAPPLAPQADIKTVAAPEAPPRALDDVSRATSTAPALARDLDANALASVPTSAVKGLDFSSVRYQDGADGALWARGRTYKARFDSASATVVPYFSPRAPRNFDVRFELQSVTAGGEALRFDGEALVSRSGDVVTLDRGLVDEQYVLGIEQLEQKFVLEQLPAAGDLTVRMAVRTELQGSTSDSGFRFANEWGHVSYGLATAIDARGRTLALESFLVDGQIELVVPAGFAASAALPLTIDPVIAIFGVDVNTTTSFSGDSSYDLSAGAVLHVYNVVFSANDWDVGGYATDRYGNVWSGSFFWNDFTSAHWVRPRVAHLGASDRFLVCAQVGQPGARAIWGQVRTVFNNSIAAPAVVSGAEIGDKFNCDVGGDTYPSLPSSFCVVYERALSAADHDIHARLVDTSGVSQASPGTLFIDNSGATLDAYPTISKTNRSSEWMVAWQRDVSGQPTNVRGARVLWNGAVTAASFPISNTSLNERRPSVSSSVGTSTNFVVACERDFVSDNDIVLYAVSGASVAFSYNLSGADGATWFNDQREPSIDSDGSHFMIGFAEYPNAPSGWNVYASEAQWITSGMSVRQHRMALATTSANEGEVQIVAARSSSPNETYADYSAIYNRGIDPWTAGPTDDVFSALIEGTYGGLVANFCDKSGVACPCFGSGVGGCPNSAFASGAHMAPTSFSRISNPNFGFAISGLKPNATALVFQGTGTINNGFGGPVGDGIRCVGGLITRFTPRSANAAGGLVFPQPTDPSLAWLGNIPPMGGFYYYQTWYRDTGAYCTSGVTNLSDAVMVEWTP